MVALSVTFLIFDALCKTWPSTAASTPLLPTLHAADDAPAQWNPLLAQIAEGDSMDERCAVWATNFLITLFVAAVMLLRIWWTCGNLPPSDTLYEPALGRVVTSSVSEEEDTVEDEDFREGGVGERRPRWIKKCARGGRATTMTAALRARPSCVDGAPSSACPCLSAYLPATRVTSAASAEDAEELFSSQRSINQEEGALMEMHPCRLPCCVRRVHRTIASLRLWRTLSSSTAVQWIAEKQCGIDTRVHGIVADCLVLIEFLMTPFSFLPALSPVFSSCGQHAYAPRAGGQQHHYHHATTCTNTARGAGDAKGPLSLLDISDDDAEDQLAEQEELWGILEGIERRRRALTGRNLFRQPLPQRRGMRFVSSTNRSSTSVATGDASAPTGQQTEGDTNAIGVAAPAVRVAAAGFPSLATGVPLSFCTDRRRRPTVVDREGRWVPVAVIDEEGEYYNYNLDLVLPLN